ncbi:MAG: sensor histidine kinase [Acidobacteriota bacterium]|nr:sensor histidine kinase [Acidobacteriota bacterium]
MNKISTRFVLLLAAAAVLPLLAYGGVSVYSLRSGTQQSVIDGNLNVARRASAEIEHYIDNNAAILRALASDLQNTDLQEWQQDRILKNYVLQFPEFREITLFDADGKLVATSRVGAPSLAFAKPDGRRIDGVWMSPITVDDDLLPTTVFTARLQNLNQPAGWLMGEFSLEEMWRMVDQIRIGQRGFALVVASGGRLIAHGDPDEKPLVAQGKNLSGNPLVRAVTDEHGEAPVWAEYESVGGRHVLGVASRIDPLGWTVIVEQPTSEAYAVSAQLQRQLVIAIGAALLLTIIVGFLWGRSFITPIHALMRGTRALASGNLNQRVQIDSMQEFNQLGEAFNTMADRLVELQEDVKKKERQAMFGRIAAGLVHDLSHPIQNIGNSCRLIVKMFDDAEYRETFKRTVDREFLSIKRVLEDLRNLARPIPLERFPVDINRSIVEMLEAMRPNGERAGVSLEGHLTEQPVFIEGDVFALGRVYRNLVTNGIQATAPGGSVVLSTALVDGFVEIRVADTGCGIPPERLGAVFEDFVTTKRRGLGLGLAISKKIVEQLDGTISVTSEVGRGTTFLLRFPATSARPAEAAVAAS